MLKPKWAYNEFYYLLCKNNCLFFRGFEHNWDLFDKFTDDKKYYFYLNDDYYSQYNFDIINDVYKHKLNHIDKLKIKLILKNDSQKIFNIQFDYIMFDDMVEHFKNDNIIVDNTFFNAFQQYSYSSIVDVICNKYIPITDIHLFILYNDDCKILLTDDFSTSLYLKKLFYKIDINIIVINDEVYDDSHENIYHIKHKLNNMFPRCPITGCNNMIDDYANYCLHSNTKFNNYNNDTLIETITSIVKKIINNDLIDIYQYIKHYLPFHVLYNYPKINDNLFDEKKIKSEYMPDYLYLPGIYIKGPYIFDDNYNYDKMLANELSFWIKLYNNNADVENTYNNNKSTINNIIKVNDNYLYVILVHPHGWYCFGEYLDSIQKLYIIDKLKLKNNNIKLVLHDHNCVVGFYDILKNLGYTDENFYIINNKTTYHFKNCLYINQLCYPARMTKITKFWFINKQITIPLTLTKKTRLYLNRNNYSQRNVINNEEILELLKQYNFIVLNGDEKIEYIINVFMNAEIIIGPHGSMFRNNIYCLNNPFIIEFCSKNRRNYAQSDLAQLSNIPYLHIL